jgi:putative Mn2+ efflux pump MntP
LLTLVFVALTLGLSNFAAAVGIGVAGPTTRTKVEIAVVFGAFEVGMPILGLALGRQIADNLGSAATVTGGGLLIAAGFYGLVTALRPRKRGVAALPESRARLIVIGLALSIDNLAVGFALGTYNVSVITAAVVIGAVSVALSLVGLDLGAHIGARIGDRAETLGSVVLIVVGARIAAGAM